MGCSPGDRECSDEEKPSHPVRISKGFWMGQTEVTVGAYKRFARSAGKPMPQEPELLGAALNKGWNEEAVPIVKMSWDDAQAYCKWMGGRLPSEAEWEYAARGGSKEARYGPIDEIAWDADNSGRQRVDSTQEITGDGKNYPKGFRDNGNRMHEVGQKRPNGFGLFDTLGNAWEWVNDWYDGKYYESSPATDPPGPSSGEYRVLRGGSWLDPPWDARASYRGASRPDFGYVIHGFRCVSEMSGP
jgi:formylglycine-generating enzyme required for sulfatase activity